MNKLDLLLDRIKIKFGIAMLEASMILAVMTMAFFGIFSLGERITLYNTINRLLKKEILNQTINIEDLRSNSDQVLILNSTFAIINNLVLDQIQNKLNIQNPNFLYEIAIVKIDADRDSFSILKNDRFGSFSSNNQKFRNNTIVSLAKIALSEVGTRSDVSNYSKNNISTYIENFDNFDIEETFLIAYRIIIKTDDMFDRILSQLDINSEIYSQNIIPLRY